MLTDLKRVERGQHGGLAGLRLGNQRLDVFEPGRRLFDEGDDLRPAIGLAEEDSIADPANRPVRVRDGGGGEVTGLAEDWLELGAVVPEPLDQRTGLQCEFGYNQGGWHVSYLSSLGAGCVGASNSPGAGSGRTTICAWRAIGPMPIDAESITPLMGSGPRRNS